MPRTFLMAEALVNVSKRSRATEAAVSIAASQTMLSLEVRDNGRDGAPSGKCHGLAGLVDTLAGVDGALELKSPDGGPTILRATILLRAASGQPLPESMRVLLAEVSVLPPEGVVRLMEETGAEVNAAVVDGKALLALRCDFPAVAVLVLSQYVELTYAAQLLAEASAGAGTGVIAPMVELSSPVQQRHFARHTFLAGAFRKARPQALSSQ